MYDSFTRGLEQAKLIYSKKSVQFALGWYWGGDSLE